MKTFKNVAWSLVVGYMTYCIATRLHFHTGFERPITHSPVWTWCVTVVMSVLVFRLLQTENK